MKSYSQEQYESILRDQFCWPRIYLSNFDVVDECDSDESNNAYL